MQYDQINIKYPIWEIKGFLLPDIVWKLGESFDQLIRSNEYGEFNSPEGLRRNLIHTNNDEYQNFLGVWNSYTVQLEQMLITTDLLIVDQM